MVQFRGRGAVGRMKSLGDDSFLIPLNKFGHSQQKTSCSQQLCTHGSVLTTSRTSLLEAKRRPAAASEPTCFS